MLPLVAIEDTLFVETRKEILNLTEWDVRHNEWILEAMCELIDIKVAI